MTQQAKGEFVVTLIPQTNETGEPTVGRLSLDKTFSGDLVGTSKGQMLAVSTATEGSAGYVAMERVVGTLAGRSGSFSLQHSGTMDRGKPSLTITVVPDSGTEELGGLSGTLTIAIVDGKHFYQLDYEITTN